VVAQPISKSRSCLQLNESEELEPSSLFLSSNERLFLPRRGSVSGPIDEYLSRIPRVVSRADELNASATELLLHERVEASRCLNVLQGEVAHASTLQADCLVSAEATTCHVVALRSTSGSTSVPLCSLAHVDQVYDSCLEAMVKEHLQHHENPILAESHDEAFGFFMDEDEVEYETPLNDNNDNTSSFIPRPLERRTASMPAMHGPIEMELHLAGGFLDKEGTSQQLSTSLVEHFSDLAEKYRGRLRISLSTAAISCMNHDEDQGPVNRGLGIDTRSGQVFAVNSALPAHLEGPAVEIRSARAFCCADAAPTLAVIHDTNSAHIRVEPFAYKADPELNVLLDVPDDVLLTFTSTSPDQESEHFCTNFRRTLSFVNTVPPETVFGHGRPLVYTRSSTNLNEWVEAYE
jgi:Protein N-terminal asparagine amidohydrolase